MADSNNKELIVPSKVTISWLAHNVPIKIWVTAFGVLGAAFVLGVQAGQIPIIREMLVIKESHRQSKVTEEYKSLISQVYSYKKSVGPAPNVGLISSAIIGLKKHEDMKEGSIAVLRSLETDIYLLKPDFIVQYKQIMLVSKDTIKYLAQK